MVACGCALLGKLQHDLANAVRGRLLRSRAAAPLGRLQRDLPLAVRGRSDGRVLLRALGQLRRDLPYAARGLLLLSCAAARSRATSVRSPA
jgi:hypothetical protein